MVDKIESSIPIDIHFHVFQTSEGLQIERVSFIPNSFLITKTPEMEKQLALLDYLSSPEFEDDINEGVLEIHERYGQLMLEMVQANCPVVSGNLRDSFYLIVSFDGVAIDSNCEYYPKIESLYGMVATAYAFYEPLILAEIDTLVASKVTI